MKNMNDIYIIKKDGTKESYNSDKILVAIGKSAKRAMVELSGKEKERILEEIADSIELKELIEVPVEQMHIFVETALRRVNPPVADEYCRYRDHKKEFAEMMAECFQIANAIQFGAQDEGDKNSNANANDTLVSTKRCLIFDVFNKQLYQNFSLNKEELTAIKDGFIYIHDMSARRDTMNCCLFDLMKVVKDGFYSAAKGGIWYNEPQSLEVFGDVAGDIILMSASQQYGGFTVPEIDKIMEYFAEKTYKRVYTETYELLCSCGITDMDLLDEKSDKKAIEIVEKEMRGCFQGWEYKFNTVASSRGDYPFITFTYGLAKSRFGKMAAIICSETRAGGQGRKGVKKPVLFPKLVFLYDENLHGNGKELEDVFNAAVACSEKSMYPDFLSLSGDGAYGSVPYMYKNYGVVISPMGCRAFLSPWFEKGGMYPADELDNPVYVGRFNIGAISLNLPMIYQKAKIEGKDFYNTLDVYLEMIRGLHLRTYAYLSEFKASSNPLAYMEGGFYGGNLKANDTIAPLLDSATASFGVTALNELQFLHNGKRLTEDQVFVNEVMDYIANKLTEYKEADHRLYAIYGTPAESLCGKQVTQFRKLYGIIPGVSDRKYVSNSFHCHVSENITPTEKQNYEYELFHKFLGGHIQYVKYNIDYNRKAMVTLIKRAMKMGFYEGVNMSMCTCEECGHKELEMKICPRCKSKNISRVDRMNGYLGWTQTGNQDTVNARRSITEDTDISELVASADTTATCDTRFSVHKLAEFNDRISM